MKTYHLYTKLCLYKAVSNSKSETKWGKLSPVMLEKFHQSVGMKTSAPPMFILYMVSIVIVL